MSATSNVGSPLPQALDQAVRRRDVGVRNELELITGGRKCDLVPMVPLDHEQVQHLQGR